MSDHDTKYVLGVPVRLGKLTKLACGVISGLEDETVGILDLRRCDLLDFRRYLPREVLEKSKNQVRVRDWLHVVVMGVAFSPFFNRNEYSNRHGVYETNLDMSILPMFEGIPVAGPAALTGRILIDSSCASWHTTPHRFEALIAHELIHSIRMMTFVVPAMQDWDGFRRRILPGAQSWFEIRRSVISGIDEDPWLEEAEYIRFFGNQGAEWFGHRPWQDRKAASTCAPPRAPPPRPPPSQIELAL